MIDSADERGRENLIQNLGVIIVYFSVFWRKEIVVFVSTDFTFWNEYRTECELELGFERSVHWKGKRCAFESGVKWD